MGHSAINFAEGSSRFPLLRFIGGGAIPSEIAADTSHIGGSRDWVSGGFLVQRGRETFAGRFVSVES